MAVRRRHRERTAACHGPPLPEEAWLKIASHLSLKEWAKAAGTCKQLWNLQLDIIGLSDFQLPPQKGAYQQNALEFRIQHHDVPASVLYAIALIPHTTSFLFAVLAATNFAVQWWKRATAIRFSLHGETEFTNPIMQSSKPLRAESFAIMCGVDVIPVELMQLLTWLAGHSPRLERLTVHLKSLQQ